MAGVNNPPNLKPLIESQSTAQSNELTAAEQAITAKVDAAKEQLLIKGSETQQRALITHNEMRAEIVQSFADSEAITNAARDEVLLAIGSLSLSPIKSIQRGSVSVNGSVVVSAVDVSKSVLNISCKSGQRDISTFAWAVIGGGYIQSAENIMINGGGSGAVIYWELIEYV